MKKLIISIYLLTGVFVIANSQIKVAEDNNVGIGVTDPVSKLAVKAAGNQYSTFYVDNNNTSTNSQRAGYFFKSSSGGDYSYAVMGHAFHSGGGHKLVGGQFSAHSASETNYKTFGIRAVAGNGYDGYNYGVFGYLYGTRNGAAIFAIEPGYSECSINGKFAGYFRGDVFVEDTIYYTTLTENSDINLKKEIRPLAQEGISHMEKINSLTPIKYKLKNPVELNLYSPEVLDTIKIDPRTKEYTAPKYTKDNIGLSAQEVQKVYPELVSKGQDGFLRMNYVDLIPILIEALKEQDAEIEILKKEIEELKTLNK